MGEQRPAYLHRFDNVRGIDELEYLSRDGNGRVREEALRRLAVLASGSCSRHRTAAATVRVGRCTNGSTAARPSFWQRLLRSWSAC